MVKDQDEMGKQMKTPRFQEGADESRHYESSRRDWLELTGPAVR